MSHQPFRFNAFGILLFCLLLLTGCGQSGPLYAPDAPPPIYVPPTDESNT